MFSLIRSSVMFLLVMTVLTGVIYPLTITAISQLVFPVQANGSLLTVEDKIVGSALIGQPFDNPKYFWSRPSATGPMPYNAAASSGSNLGPIEPALTSAFKTRADALKAADPDNEKPIPVELITASGSGLDPHISPAAAEYQIVRVAKVRGVPQEAVQAIVHRLLESRQLGVLGEPHINVLQLNLELDNVFAHNTVN